MSALTLAAAMPEGDTIHRTAQALARVLVGKVVRRATSSMVRAASLEGRAVRAVEAVGKHLLIRFDRGPTLRTHMRMTGSWHLYRSEDPSTWQRAAHRARVVLVTDAAVAVCFDAVVELAADANVDGFLDRALGPDVVADTFDANEARRRLRARGDMEIGAALLDQHALSGIGNIYKSETLFHCRIAPFLCVRDLDDATLDRVVLVARRMMRANVPRGGRTTSAIAGMPHAVYRRKGAACVRCGGTITMRRQGTPPRSTYWCPRCQRGPTVKRLRS